MTEPASTTASTAGVLSVGNIRGFGKSDVGMFRIAGDLFGWKNRRTGTVHQYKLSDIEKVEWMKTGAHSYQLIIRLSESKNNATARFDAFPEKNFREITQHFQEQIKVPVVKAKAACRGWHWGEYAFKDKKFCFSIDNRNALEISPQDIQQISIPAKTDLAIQLKHEDAGPAEDQLLDIRFCLPPKGDVDEMEAQLESLKQEMLSESGVGEKMSDTVVMLTDIPLLIPRGRYEIDLGRKGLKLHGKSHDYTVQYKSITRMLLVPRPNSPHVAFVIGLENALRLGQTRYPFIIMQLENEAVLSVDVNMEESTLESLQLEKTLEGKACDVVTRLFRALVGRSIVVPGDFKSSNESSCVTCSYRAASGHLYPLNRSFLFIVKPVIFIRYDDVLSVQFSRISQNRYFSFSLSVRGEHEYEFTSIDRNEYQPLTDFIQSKGLRIKNLQAEFPVPTDTLAGNVLPSDESDEDFDEEESDEEYAEHDGGGSSEEGSGEDEEVEEEDEEKDGEKEDGGKEVKKKRSKNHSEEKVSMPKKSKHSKDEDD